MSELQHDEPNLGARQSRCRVYEDYSWTWQRRAALVLATTVHSVQAASRTGKVVKLNDSSRQPITMTNDRVLVLVPPAEGERRSRSGILIPATAQVAKRLSWAEVVAVGPAVRVIKVGDTVLFNAEECAEVEVQGEAYLILRERDIHALASERNDGGTGLYL